MIEKCPSCGTSLSENFNFCPKCGYELKSSSKKNDLQEPSEIKKDIIICEVCGEENIFGNEYCQSCGASLPGATSEKKVNTTVLTTPEKSDKKTPGKNKALKGTPPLQAKQHRSLSKMQTILIFVVAFGITLILLITSGIFDQAPETSSTNLEQPVQQNQSSGVDLSTLNEINALEEKVKANPDDTQSLLHLAHLKNDSGMYEQAIVTYKKYLEKNPSDADARVDMGVCYYNMRDYPTAIAEMKKALEYNSNHQIAHLNLGIVNLTAGNLDESKKWFQRTVEIEPNSEVGKRAKELLESH